MYDAKKARVSEERERFNRLADDGLPGARAAGEAYLASLADLIDTFHDGPAADPRVMEADTTGELSRTEDEVASAEQERHRVTRKLRDML